MTLDSDSRNLGRSERFGPLDLHGRAAERAAVRQVRGDSGFTLWRTMTKERTFSFERMSRVDEFRMVKRRLRDAGLPEAANCDNIRTA